MRACAEHLWESPCASQDEQTLGSVNSKVVSRDTRTAPREMRHGIRQHHERLAAQTFLARGWWNQPGGIASDRGQQSRASSHWGGILRPYPWQSDSPESAAARSVIGLRSKSDRVRSLMHVAPSPKNSATDARSEPRPCNWARSWMGAPRLCRANRHLEPEFKRVACQDH